MRVVIAPDKFKGSLSAPQVAAHLAIGIRTVAPLTQIVAVPLADGGEGTIEAAVSAGFVSHTVRVSGPTGRPVEARFATRSGEAVIELAQASGLAVLPGGIRDALGAGTRGTGELIRSALDRGCRRIILGVGGSASTDGGAGMLQGLGIRLLDSSDRELPGGGAALASLYRIDLSGLDPRLASAEIILASDVANPLLGTAGAATVFGPQKGASALDVELLEQALHQYVRVLGAEVGPIVRAIADAPGAGAAGGTGFAALAVLAAVRRPGIVLVLELTRFEQHLDGADLVITGEGSIDEQTLFGKTPVGVAKAAAAHGIPVYAVCGRSSLDRDRLLAAGFSQTFALTDIERDLDTCMRDAGELLERTGERIARQLLSLSETSQRQ